MSEEREKLRADKAEAELRAFKRAMVLVMGKDGQAAMAMLERVAAALVLSEGF